MTKGLNSEDNSVAVYTFKRIGSNKSLSTFQDWNQHRQCRKLSEEKKQGFIDLVTKKNITMKSAAKMIGISYSTAKKIYSRFRTNILTTKNNIQFEHKDLLVRASYSQIKITPHPISIISLIAGKNQ